MTKVEWIESAGGPLLLAPRSSTKGWLGAEGSKLAGLKTDYARACSMACEIGVISIHSRSGLVLGDEPDRTALLPVRSTAEVLLIRWRCADSEDSLLSRLLAAHAANTLEFVTAGRFVTSAEEYLLFDSTCSGAQINRYLSAPLHAGSYLIETASFKPDGATFACVHRLKSYLRTD